MPVARSGLVNSADVSFGCEPVGTSGFVYTRCQPALRRHPVTRSPLRASCRVRAAVCLFGLPGRRPPGSACQTRRPPANELDAFMEKVLKRREVNRQTLEQYVLDENEQFEVLGPSRMPVYRQKREFTWYVRDGLHVRSPVRFDGVTVGDAARKEYEDDWARARARAARAKEKRRTRRDKETGSAEAPDAAHVGRSRRPSGASPIPTPRFVSEAYFMDFKFEPGNYYLAGREQLEGQQVLRIEYYPTRMFNDRRRRQGRGDEREGDGRAAQTSDRERKRRKRAHRAPDEQDRARDALGRSGRASDRQVHVRQRLDGLSPGGLARQGRRHPGVDDDGTAVPRTSGCRAR